MALMNDTLKNRIVLVGLGSGRKAASQPSPRS